MNNDAVVFVIDDDVAVLNSLRWLIESAGHRVETFRSAREFLERLTPAMSGCVVLDIRMPEMSGLELQEELGARNFDLPHQ